MKTAILYSGHMRSFSARVMDNHHDQVLRHFPDADIYLSTITDPQSHNACLLEAKYGVRITFQESQPDFPLPPGCPDKWTPGKFYMYEPYHISVSPAAILGQLWQLQNVWKLIPDGKEYDCYIRIRPDIWFQEFSPPQISHGLIQSKIEAHTPWWGRFGGCNDRFAILGAKAAEAYFNTFNAVDRLIAGGAPLHPETLIKRQLQAEGCFINDRLWAIFGTLRTSGEMRQPEISGVDIAHYSGQR